MRKSISPAANWTTSGSLARSIRSGASSSVDSIGRRPLVNRELERVSEPHRSSYLNLTAALEQVELTEEAAILADGYISRGIFHRKYIADALHVAIASCHKIDYLVTWNFGHLANVRRQARIRLFNTAAGFYVPMIVTPEFLVSEATEKVG